MLFLNKKCLVQSASKGIGYGIAKSLLQNGGKVTISSSSKNRINQAAKKLKDETGMQPDTLVLDNYKHKEFIAKLDEFLIKQNGIDILIVNGPGPPACLLEEFNENNLRKEINGLFEIPIISTNMCTKYMIKQKFGRILFILSTTAKQPEQGMGYSNIIRSGLWAFMKTLSKELGTEGINSNAVLVGACETDRMKELMQQEAKHRKVSIDKIKNEALKIFPSTRFPNPDEFANQILSLISPESFFINE